MSLINVKVCSKCGELKKITEFAERKDAKSGVRNQCKKCRNYLENLHEKNNREQRNLYIKEYRKRNPERYRQYQRNWEKKNPEKVKAMRKNNTQKYPETRGYLRHKFCATSRNFIPLCREIWKEIVKEPCFYCGGINNTLGIDRVDNNIGYTKENSVSCCGICNRMKVDSTFDNFIDRCYLISEYQEYKKGEPND